MCRGWDGRSVQDSDRKPCEKNYGEVPDGENNCED